LETDELLAKLLIGRPLLFNQKNFFMKIKRTEQRLLIALTAVITGAMILYTACRKPFNPDMDASSLIGKAKNWFMNDVVNKERDMLEKPDSILGLYVRRFARMQKLGSLLNWNEAKEYNQDGIHFVVSLVNQGRKPFKNQNFEAARAIIFYLDRSGRMKMNIIEILSNKGSSLGSDLQQIARLAFVNKQVKKNDRIEGLNGSVIFYTENYKQESSFQIVNGVWSSARIELKNQATVKKRPLNTRNQRTTCQTCTHWYLVGYWYDTQTFQVVNYEILSEWDECMETGSPGSPEYGPEPSSSIETCNETDIQNNGAAALAAIESVSDNLEVITTLPETVAPNGTIRREKDYEWEFGRSRFLFYYWYFKSYEHGVHIRLGDTWYWESLTHVRISPMLGSAPGEVTCTIHSATPSFYAANLKARMTLNWVMSLKIACKGVTVYNGSTDGTSYMDSPAT
jgi:hypothetical protein